MKSIPIVCKGSRHGMEIESHYCDVITKRWEDYTGKKAELVKKYAL